MELQPAERRAYALSGKATLTLEGRTSRFTYRIEANRGNSRATHWVYSLNGPDNEKDYRFIGGILPEEGFYHSGKSQVTANAPCVEAFRWFWQHIDDTRMRVYHSGRCGRCGRTLTTPESIQTGLGPKCGARRAA